MSTVRRIRFRKGLKVDRAEWQVLRDTYSLLDPAHHIPRCPRFAFSSEPFLILLDRFGRRGLKAGIQRSDEGRKIWWLEWLRDGKEQMHMCPDSLQDLLSHLDGTLFEMRRIASRYPKRKKGRR